MNASRPSTEAEQAHERLASAQLIVVSGLSGAGKTVIVNALEDLEFFCVDNLPAGLLEAFAEQTILAQAERYPRVAVGIDARNRAEDIAALPAVLSALAARGVRWALLYARADEPVLLKRFSETRRRHPLSRHGVTLSKAIAQERDLLADLDNIADLVLDTSQQNVHQLKRAVIDAVQPKQQGLTLMFESFAYRHGVPAEADYVFDARSLPNPHWIPALRPLTGRDAGVRNYFATQAEVGDYLAEVQTFLSKWMQRGDAQRSYLTVAIGCSGGRHRSVYLAEALAEAFRDQHDFVICHHRELA